MLIGKADQFLGFGCLEVRILPCGLIKINSMNENINLCEILKGHECETFYCSLIGQDVKLEHVGKFVPDSCKHIVVITSTFEKFDFWDDGSYIRNIDGKDSVGEMQLFPSKDQRDWSKWDKENNPLAPHHASVAQLAERDTCNIVVIGSIPV